MDTLSEDSSLFDLLAWNLKRPDLLSSPSTPHDESLGRAANSILCATGEMWATGLPGEPTLDEVLEYQQDQRDALREANVKRNAFLTQENCTMPQCFLTVEDLTPCYFK